MGSPPRRAPAHAPRALGVEALLIDPTSFGGCTLAPVLDVPFVSVCGALTNLASPPVWPGAGHRPAQCLRQHGIHCFPTRMVSAAPASGLPSGAELRARERLARKVSSGIGPTDLQGCWLLDQVWPKSGDRPALFSNAMLRGLGARLEIRLSDQPEELDLSNAVRLGALELRFHGRGRLVGSRPLLKFQFDALVLSLADRPLLRRSLPPPKPQRMPFFALIARGPEGWLAARGRGGGLALWRLASLPHRLASDRASTEAAPEDG